MTSTIQLDIQLGVLGEDFANFVGAAISGDNYILEYIPFQILSKENCCNLFSSQTAPTFQYQLCKTDTCRYGPGLC